jgi:hypothetical protein
MGKENAGTISPTSPILDSIGRRKSVAYTNDRIKEMILKAPFIETVEKIGGSDEGDGDRESFASALSLWITDVIVPDVRKEVLNESEKEAQQAVRVVQTEMRGHPRLDRMERSSTVTWPLANTPACSDSETAAVTTGIVVEWA